MSRLAALGLLGLGACAQPARQLAPEQLVIVIDEAGSRVPGATVELTECGLGPQTDPSEPGIVTARADQDGIAHFRDLPAWTYYCDAYLEPRASLPQGADFIEYESLPGKPVTITIQELHVGGLDAPGLRWIAFREGRLGPHFFPREEFRYPEYVKAVNTSLASEFPTAMFLSGLRVDPDSRGADLVEVNAEWYGYKPTWQRVRMVPASQFRDPQLIRREDLQPCAWAEVPVRLLEPSGVAVPPQTSDAILRRSRLLLWPNNGENYHPYSPSLNAARGWTVAAPCAEYRFQLLGSDWRWPEFLASFDLTVDTTEVVVILPEVVRLVRVHVEGPPGGFRLIPQYESGTESAVWTDQDDSADLILPPGNWGLELEYYYSDHGFDRFTRTITVGDADAQDLTWTVTRG